MKFTVRADRQLIRAGARSRRFLCAEIQAPEAPNRPGRLPVNLAFVLDRSGSMEGEKIAHARAAILQGIRSLRDEDRFAVVAYDDQIDVVVSTALATAAAREAATQAVARIAPRASTDLEGGWGRGCEQVVEHLSAEAVGRCILLTDGLANAGVTDHDEIVRRCAAWRERRVATTAFCVGADFDETLLRRMADAGGGHFEFIESAVQIADFVASEVGEALAISAREAVLVVEAGEGAVVESLNDFPCRQDGSAWRVDGRGAVHRGQPRGERPPAPRPHGGPPRRGAIRGSRRARRAREKPRARLRGRTRDPRALHRAHPALRRRRPGDPGRGREPGGEGRSLR